MKEREKSLKLLKLEAVLRRLPKSHHRYSEVEKEFAKSLAGYRGEKSIDYYLSYLNDDYLIFNNIRLQDKKHYFQIDTLLVSSSFLCILEVKNIAGTLYFDEAFDQMIRTLNDKEEAFSSPLLQLSRQQYHLRRWLEEHKIPLIPCEGFVVISQPSTIIKSSNARNPQIIHSANIPAKMEGLEKRLKEQIMTKQNLKKLVKKLNEKHAEEIFDPIVQFNLKETDILTGVHCPICGQYPLSRSYGFWRCSSCKQKSKDAHLQALEDYKHLFGPQITNQKLRLFLHISSRTSATKLLLKLNYPHEGKTSSRIYFIS